MSYDNLKFMDEVGIKKIITFPLRTALAAANSACGTTPFSAPNVLITDERLDGTDKP